MPIDTPIGMPIYSDLMKTDEAIKHFGTQQATANALEIKQSSVAEWGEYPPEVRQLQIHRLTQGKLRAESEVIEKFGEPRVEKKRAA